MVRSLLWATVGAATAVPLLVVPGVVDPALPGVIHLTLLAGFGLALTFHLAPLADPPWFRGTGLGESGRAALTGIVIAAAVSASVAAATVPTAVALRYDASLQFLVLLAAVISAGQSALMALGTRAWLGPRAGVAAGLIPGVVTVALFWRYLDLVGTGPGGSWVVDGARFGTLVLPVEAVLTVASVIAFSRGTRRRSRPGADRPHTS